MRLAFPLLLAVLAGPHAGLAAASDPLHLTGSRVRLFVSDRSTAAGRLSSRVDNPGKVAGVEEPTLVAVFPNPSAGALNFRVTVPTPGRVRLRLFDCRGQLIATVTDTYETGGSIGYRWDGVTTRGRMATGLYIARLDFRGLYSTRQVVVVH